MEQLGKQKKKFEEEKAMVLKTLEHQQNELKRQIEQFTQRKVKELAELETQKRRMNQGRPSGGRGNSPQGPDMARQGGTNFQDMHVDEGRRRDFGGSDGHRGSEPPRGSSNSLNKPQLGSRGSISGGDSIEDDQAAAQRELNDLFNDMQEPNNI